MPAFTFEKLSPAPPPSDAVMPVVEKRRNVIGQMLDRFAEMRARRTASPDKAAIPPPHKKKSQD